MGNRTCRVGLHGRNNVTFAEVDFQVVNTARIEAMKMMGQTDPAVFKRLKQENPDIDLITRLYDDRFGANTHPSAEQFVAKQIPVIKALQPYCAKFEIHNEPNHLKGYEGWGQEDYHARDFNAWFLRVYDLIKATCPWAELGFPGLAIPHRDLEWIEICRPSVERADWLGVHCYWQTPAGQEKNHLTNFWGLRFKYYHQKFPTKIIEITECGNSNIQAEPPIAISDEALGRQFVEYFQELFKYPYLNSASFFILSSQDPTWDFFTWRSENGRIKPVAQQVGQMQRPALAPTQTVYKPVTPTDNATGVPVVIGGGQNAVTVQITNITAGLTQSATERYPIRAQAEINRIIIHHTAVSEKVGAARIAQVQVEQLGKPGITYHYFIAFDGTIYQTNDLTTVADHTQGHNQNSLAVCFAGNFTAEIPTEAQLKAGGALCAALMLQLNIPPANVQGASELVNTQSPGKQWLTGQKWQALLVKRINEARAVTPTEPVSPVIPVDGAQIALLKAQIAQLTSQLAQAQARISQLEAELARLKSSPSVDQSDIIADLREYIALLELQLSVAQESAGLPGTTPASHSVEPPPIRDITASLARHATERYLSRDKKAIKKLIIHHTGVPASITTERIAAFNVTKNGWPGIGFHYVITEDGVIQQTNALETIAYHAGSDNDTGIGIAFAGEFSHTAPTSAQISRGGHLIAWLLNSLSLPPNAVLAHKDVADSPCPGKEWDSGQNWRTLLLQAVQNKLTGGASTGAPVSDKTYHYMLFKDQADMTAAAAYLNKFQPQTGFNAEEALGATYVSVAGNYTPFPADTEARLRANGAKIDRIAGNSPLAVQALLDNMTRTNRRFLTLTEGG